LIHHLESDCLEIRTACKFVTIGTDITASQLEQHRSQKSLIEFVKELLH
jgi:hypothetical protein